ncbi:MAG: hypothetical protein CW348_15685 [Thermobifida sp.]|nr:hypothetical protein [Thermobifida sp.]
MTPFHFVLTVTLPGGKRITASGRTTVVPGATRSAVVRDLLEQVAADMGVGRRQLTVDFLSLERDQLEVS